VQVDPFGQLRRYRRCQRYRLRRRSRLGRWARRHPMRPRPRRSCPRSRRRSNSPNHRYSLRSRCCRSWPNCHRCLRSGSR